MKNASVYKTPEGEKAVMAFSDAILKRWSVPHETLNVATRYGNTTFIIASGRPSSPPLVLLGGRSEQQWNAKPEEA